MARTRPRHRARSGIRALPASAALVAVLAGCSQGGLDPHGEEARRILDVFWALLVAATVVSVLVCALWAWGALRRRGDVGDQRLEHVADTRHSRWLVVGGGLIMPALVMAGFFGVQIVSVMEQRDADVGELTIEITAHQYWWEVRYRGIESVDAFETANEVHIPTDTNVTVELRSRDVIHSFWVPELAGKVDMVPGRVNEFVMSAEDPGRYRGYCAEYCGLQHAWMKIEVVASTADEFHRWAADQAAPASVPDTPAEQRGREVFLGQSCVGCHTIRGVAEEAGRAPDLTHLAARSDIGAGVRELSEEDLRAWIANAQAIKPGVNMPPQELTQEELDALVAYLMSLE